MRLRRCFDLRLSCVCACDRRDRNGAAIPNGIEPPRLFPCVPYKWVIVGYKCATESRPIVYRCLCKGKYYHVPSH